MVSILVACLKGSVKVSESCTPEDFQQIAVATLKLDKPMYYQFDLFVKTLLQLGGRYRDIYKIKCEDVTTMELSDVPGRPAFQIIKVKFQREKTRDPQIFHIFPHRDDPRMCWLFALGLREAVAPFWVPHRYLCDRYSGTYRGISNKVTTTTFKLKQPYIYLFNTLLLL